MTIIDGYFLPNLGLDDIEIPEELKIRILMITWLLIGFFYVCIVGGESHFQNS